jgi:DNA-binding NarL/FixJ family response regulator
MDRSMMNSQLKLAVPQVLQIMIMAEGEKTDKIAKTLFISVSTYYKHRHNLIKKPGMSNVADLTRFAVDNQIVSE